MQTAARRLLFPYVRAAGVTVVAFIAGALVPAGCGRISPTEPIPQIDQACCAEGDTKLQTFKGCIVGRKNCPKSHKWWMRGQVECTAVDEEACAGGRCCNYAQQYDKDLNEPLEDWAPPGFPAEDKPEPADDGSEPDPPPEPEPEPTPVAAPEPAGASVIVTLAGDGAASIEGDALTTEALQTRLCEVAKALPDVAVTVMAESDTPQSAVIGILDVAKQCGIKRVSMEQTTD